MREENAPIYHDSKGFRLNAEIEMPKPKVSVWLYLAYTMYTTYYTTYTIQSNRVNLGYTTT